MLIYAVSKTLIIFRIQILLLYKDQQNSTIIFGIRFLWTLSMLSVASFILKNKRRVDRKYLTCNSNIFKGIITRQIIAIPYYYFGGFNSAYDFELMKQLFVSRMHCLEEEVETNVSRKCLSLSKKNNADNLDRTSLLVGISSQAASLEFMRVRCFFAATANNDDRVATESHIDLGFVETNVDIFLLPSANKHGIETIA